MSSELDEWDRAATICRLHGWTWQEYQDQPGPFIDAIVAMARAQAREQEKQSKRNG